MRIESSLAVSVALWATTVAAAGLAGLPERPGVFVNPTPASIEDFTLTDQDGKARTFSSLRGTPVLVFFGFTHCPSICPTTLARLKSLHTARGGAVKPAKIVFISVDGDRDTPERLKSYLAPVSADFIGLTGDPKATSKIAARFAAVFFKEPAAKDGSYNVMHSTQVFALDKAGRLRATFVDASIEDMATITDLLLKEPG
jgi:protein SCO1/2